MIIQLSKFIEPIKFSNDLYIFLFGCNSGNKKLRIEQIDIKAEVLFLSLKYKGEIAFTNSVLKYPSLFSFFEL